MSEETKTTVAGAEGEAVESQNLSTSHQRDIAPGGQFAGMQVHTRFPPEPTATFTSALQGPHHRLRLG
mgnify:CR=1 FL=1